MTPAENITAENQNQSQINTQPLWNFALNVSYIQHKNMYIISMPPKWKVYCFNIPSVLSGAADLSDMARSSLNVIPNSPCSAPSTSSKDSLTAL